MLHQRYPARGLSTAKSADTERMLPQLVPQLFAWVLPCVAVQCCLKEHEGSRVSAAKPLN